MLASKQHVLPARTPSTNGSPIGMPKSVPRGPWQAQPGAKENRGHPKRSEVKSSKRESGAKSKASRSEAIH